MNYAFTRPTETSGDPYIRVSRVGGREGDSFISPEVQKRSIEQYAAAFGHEIIEWHTDLDQSGGKMNRPAFQVMMARVDTGATQGVIVAKLDRFARTLVGALKEIERLSEHDAVLVCVAENFDPSTPMGKAFMQIALVFAELELDRNKAGWKQTFEDVILERGIQPTIAPFGYRKQENKVFEPDSVESPYLREIFLKRAQAETWQAIAEHLNDEAIPPRKAEQWSPRAVKDMVRNEVYLGVARKGSYRKEDAHQPLVSKAEWLAAQDVFARGPSPHTGRHERYELRGLVRCSGCCYTMSSASYRPKGQERKLQYQCKVRHGSGDCPSPANINQSRLLPHVKAGLFAKLRSDQRLRPVVTDSGFEEADTAYELAKDRLERYRDDVEREELLGRDRYMAGLRKLASELDSATRAREEAKRRAAGTDLPSVDALEAAWPTMTNAERLTIYGRALDGIFIRRGRGTLEERVTLVWKGEFPGTLSMSGRSVPIQTLT